MSVSKSLRFQVLRRDNHQCRYCGRSAPEWPMRIDHVVPVALGGPDDPSNLVTACADCNAGKAATPADATIVADVEQDALRWAAAMALAVELQQTTAADARNFEDSFAGYWDDFTAGGRAIPRDPNWRASVKAFRTAGLDGGDLGDAIEVTMAARQVAAAKKWRYFCGVCWKKVGQRRELAAQFLAEEEAGGGALTDALDAAREAAASKAETLDALFADGDL